MFHRNGSLWFTRCMLAAASALAVLGCGDGDDEQLRPVPTPSAFRTLPTVPTGEARELDLPRAQPPRRYPDLPEAVSSFGAALADDTIYTYGGNLGGGFAAEHQSTGFRRLSLAQGGAWEDLGAVEHLESIALVAHGGFIYRIGGLRVDSAIDEPEVLTSVATVQRYDPREGTWQAMPDLPEGRSGHGAVVVGDRLYVVGGWTLAGPGELLTRGVVLDLSTPDAAWVPLPEAPFTLRSLGVARRGDTIYALGGVGEGMAFSGEVYRFDTKTEAWSPGPALPSEIPIAGFGATACNDEQDLYINIADGLFRLNAAGDGWEPAGALEFTRYFSPLICPGDGEVIVLGGRSAADNELTASVESVDVAQ
ncbi:kelch-like protein [Sorangium sp. So ce302]|uniref:Kelch repeat-containing protein n=1 Tax=Sorangium sp. So ce302 TaxID=3133297 RepID=UPI003F630C66